MPSPLYKTHYSTEQRTMKKERHPSSGRGEILPKRLAFVREQKVAHYLQNNRKGPARKQNTIDQQKSHDAFFAFDGPVL